MNLYNFKLLDFNYSSQTYLFKVLDKTDKNIYKFLFIPYSMYSAVLILDFLMAKRDLESDEATLVFLNEAMSRDIEKNANDSIIIVSDIDDYMKGIIQKHSVAKRTLFISDVLSHLQGKYDTDKHSTVNKEFISTSDNRFTVDLKNLLFILENDRFVESNYTSNLTRHDVVESSVLKLEDFGRVNEFSFQTSAIIDGIASLTRFGKLTLLESASNLKSIGVDGVVSSFNPRELPTEVLSSFHANNPRELKGSIYFKLLYDRYIESDLFISYYMGELQNLRDGLKHVLLDTERFYLNFSDILNLYDADRLDSHAVNYAPFLITGNYGIHSFEFIDLQFLKRHDSYNIEIENIDLFGCINLESVVIDYPFSFNKHNFNFAETACLYLFNKYSSNRAEIADSYLFNKYSSNYIEITDLSLLGDIGGHLSEISYSYSMEHFSDFSLSDLFILDKPDSNLIGILNDSLMAYSDFEYVEILSSLELDRFDSSQSGAEGTQIIESSLYKESDVYFSYEEISALKDEKLVAYVNDIFVDRIKCSDIVLDIHSIRFNEHVGDSLDISKAVKQYIKINGFIENSLIDSTISDKKFFTISELISSKEYSIGLLDSDFILSNLINDRLASILVGFETDNSDFYSTVKLQFLEDYIKINNAQLSTDTAYHRFFEVQGVNENILIGILNRSRLAYLDLYTFYEAENEFEVELSYGFALNMVKDRETSLNYSISLSKFVFGYSDSNIDFSDYEKYIYITNANEVDKAVGLDGYIDTFFSISDKEFKPSDRVIVLFLDTVMRSGYSNVEYVLGEYTEKSALIDDFLSIGDLYKEPKFAIIESQFLYGDSFIGADIEDAAIAGRSKRKKLNKENIKTIDFQRGIKKDLDMRTELEFFKVKLKELNIELQGQFDRDIYKKLDAAERDIDFLNERDRIPSIISNTFGLKRKQKEQFLDFTNSISLEREQFKELLKGRVENLDYEKTAVLSELSLFDKSKGASMLSELSLFDKSKGASIDEASKGKGLLYDYSNILEEGMLVDKWKVGYAIPENYDPKDPFNSYYPWAEEYTAHGMIQGREWIGEGEWVIDKENINISINNNGFVLSDNKFTNFKFTFDVTISENPNHRSGTIFNYIDENNYYKFTISSSAVVPFELIRVYRGVKYKLAIPMYPVILNPLVKHSISISLTDNRLVIYVNDHIQYDLVLEY